MTGLEGNLPTSSRAAEVRTALNMVDRERDERERLRAEVERLREALGGMVPPDPYDVDQDCRWCGSRIYQPHRDGCAWAIAKAALDA
jgi:hypothetical protein